MLELKSLALRAVLVAIELMECNGSIAFWVFSNRALGTVKCPVTNDPVCVRNMGLREEDLGSQLAARIIKIYSNCRAS